MGQLFLFVLVMTVADDLLTAVLLDQGGAWRPGEHDAEVVLARQGQAAQEAARLGRLWFIPLMLSQPKARALYGKLHPLREGDFEGHLLRIAAQHGQEHWAQTLLSCSPSLRNAALQRALMVAVELGDVPALETLMKWGANFNQGSSSFGINSKVDQATPDQAVIAAARGHRFAMLDCLDQLFGLRNHGKPCLMCAVKSQSEELIDFLLPKVSDDARIMALKAAAEKGEPWPLFERILLSFESQQERANGIALAFAQAIQVNHSELEETLFAHLDPLAHGCVALRRAMAQERLDWVKRLVPITNLELVCHHCKEWKEWPVLDQLSRHVPEEVAREWVKQLPHRLPKSKTWLEAMDEAQQRQSEAKTIEPSVARRRLRS
jgi:hypothetical protein